MASSSRTVLSEEEILDLLEQPLSENESESDFDYDSDSFQNNSSDNNEENSDNVHVSSDSEEDSWRMWSDTDTDFKDFPFDESKCGFITESSSVPSLPIGFFQLIFTDNLFQQIADETNRYATSKIRKVTPLPQHSTWWDWRNVTMEEMKRFHDCFSHRQFMQIFWALHVYNLTSATHVNIQVQSRLSKVKNVLNYLSGTFLEIYQPYQYLAADESTVSFKGHVLFKMYNPQKPTKRGLRVYLISDSANGYICSLIPYFGAVTTELLICPHLNFSEKIVLHLLANIINATGQSWYHLYTGCFYTSVALADELLKQNMHLTGMIQANRKNLPAAIKKGALCLRKHEIKCLCNNKMMVLALQDK
ncbi:piggyBac transposable element-derived protein 1-like [Schistocerca cancellata]|uniref:piggyBac transposable element-derived protein 1-like n=1 Tax=Schistocerca cancellata TaxID=274614 RepID=UPI00211734A4|nr:piggyBac transposable element-derived protein 1-like [Schistocerca cancellata]